MSFIPKPGDVASMRFWGLDSRGAQASVAGIIAVALFVLGAWLLVTGVVSVASAQSILADGGSVTAKVASVQSTVPNPVGSPGDTVETNTVHFVTSTGEQVDTDLPAVGIQRVLEPGDSVRIRYDRAHPSRVLLDGDGILAGLAVGIWAGALLALVGVALGLVTVRILRRGPFFPAA